MGQLQHKQIYIYNILQLFTPHYHNIAHIYVISPKIKNKWIDSTFVMMMIL